MCVYTHVGSHSSNTWHCAHPVAAAPTLSPALLSPTHPLKATVSPHPTAHCPHAPTCRRDLPPRSPLNCPRDAPESGRCPPVPVPGIRCPVLTAAQRGATWPPLVPAASQPESCGV